MEILQFLKYIPSGVFEFDTRLYLMRRETLDADQPVISAETIQELLVNDQIDHLSDVLNSSEI
jgi:hypothetical protein